MRIETIANVFSLFMASVLVVGATLVNTVRERAEGPKTPVAVSSTFVP